MYLRAMRSGGLAAELVAKIAVLSALAAVSTIASSGCDAIGGLIWQPLNLLDESGRWDYPRLGRSAGPRSPCHVAPLLRAPGGCRCNAT